MANRSMMATPSAWKIVPATAGRRCSWSARPTKRRRSQCKPILGRHVDEPEACRWRPAGMSGEFGIPPNSQIDPLDTHLSF
jgi:hypothetical protein